MLSDNLEELEARRQMAMQMGGLANVDRQRAQGKLPVRERIELLVDPDSFEEFGMLSGSATYDNGRLASFTPKGHVDGICTIEGRRVVVSAGDFTVRGGSAGGLHGALGAELSATERALEWRLPYIRLLDAAGGSVRTFEELGRTYLPDGNSYIASEISLLNVAPVVSVVMGSVAGLPAVQACMAHWNVMVQGTSQLFPGGPPVVKAAFGQDILKEDLGGSAIHTRISGVVDNLASTEEDALNQARRFLSYLPSSVDEMAPWQKPTEPKGSPEELRGLVPENRRTTYNPRRLLDLVLDEGSVFEIAPYYGRSRITALARVGGFPVGIMANDARYLGGATDVAAGEKVIRLMQLCDTFHLPLVSFADEPGFLVGLASEHQGIERAGARLVWAVCESRMPMITFVLGRLYGVAGQCHHRPSGMFRRYAWPSARWGSMHIMGGVSAAYRREIADAADPDEKRREIEKTLENIASPFRTAEATGQDIIDPAETRPALLTFVRDAQRVLRRQVGTAGGRYRP
jgi:acetyl-CoA carboxylase carboxyltransferase component